MYLVVMGIYGSLVISSSQLRDPGVMQTDVYTGAKQRVARGGTQSYRSISAGGDVTVYGEGTSLSPSQPARGMTPSGTVSLYGV